MLLNVRRRINNEKSDVVANLSGRSFAPSCKRKELIQVCSENLCMVNALGRNFECFY